MFSELTEETRDEKLSILESVGLGTGEIICESELPRVSVTIVLEDKIGDDSVETTVLDVLVNLVKLERILDVEIKL